jgi:hypothetical protein
MTWIAPHRDELLRKHGHKYTAAQFASAWDTTRNAVLGRAFRLGISLRKEPRPPVARKTGKPGRPRLPVKIRAAGVAAVLAGATYRKAAALVGASDCAVWNWSRDAETLGAAYQLLAIAKADACQRRAA